MSITIITTGIMLRYIRIVLTVIMIIMILRTSLILRYIWIILLLPSHTFWQREKLACLTDYADRVHLGDDCLVCRITKHEVPSHK